MAKPAPYSYRDDPRVPSFDDSEPLIVFDGGCVLCAAGVQWMAKRDPKGRARFIAIEAPLARALYEHYALDPVRFDTFMVLTNGVARLRWQGLLAAGRTMPAPWSIAALLGRLIPDAIGDRLYDFIQKNRIAWFGARKSCLVPDGALRERFL